MAVTLCKEVKLIDVSESQLSDRNSCSKAVQRLQLVNDNRRMQDGSISTQSLERVPSSSIYSEACTFPWLVKIVMAMFRLAEHTEQ